MTAIKSKMVVTVIGSNMDNITDQMRLVLIHILAGDQFILVSSLY